ncbi:hypothetical protein SLEP1_g10983 [Rubroshorea leprosula]|uniref:Uncharacterized protein n=1 Tax=Rubroshorea leprosula TaxID=152421 RepID=A0AAV5IHS5_9ROSI|nr:hypothetical protein SLEP1_g10983 [Rubroshorea leprosula]
MVFLENPKLGSFLAREPRSVFSTENPHRSGKGRRRKKKKKIEEGGKRRKKTVKKEEAKG